jgi:hypothetical protein
MIRKSGYRFSEKIMLKQKDRAFSSEVDTGSREENASTEEIEPPFRFDRNGNGSKIAPL